MKTRDYAHAALIISIVLLGSVLVLPWVIDYCMVSKKPTYDVIHYLPNGTMVEYKGVFDLHSGIGNSLGFQEWPDFFGRYTYIQGTYKIRPTYKAVKHYRGSNEWEIVDK